MLIIYPPFSKACEPAAALGQLRAHLEAHQLYCNTCDLNIEGLQYLLDIAPFAPDNWSKRAIKNKNKNIDELRTNNYHRKDQYLQAVLNINRLVEITGKKHNLRLNLSNYSDLNLSPQKSEDLLHAAEHYQNNIFYPFFRKRIPQLIEQYNPKFIGISLNFLSQALCAFAIIGFIRKTIPNIKIILGGGLVTTWLKSPFWNSPFESLVDHFITGKGENKLLKLVADKDSEYSSTPDYSEVADNQYLSPGLILPYATSMGCFWKKCSFCPETSEDTPYTCLSPSKVISDLRTLEHKHKPILFHLVDSALSPKNMRAIIDAQLKTPWYSFARLCPELADLDFTTALKKAGCKMLKLGIESGSEKVLEQMNKGIDLQLVSKVLKNLQHTGIATYIYLLFGTPSENHREARKTLNFIAEHDTAVNFLNLSVFNLPICSSSTSELIITDQYQGDLSVYADFIHPQDWNRKKIRVFLEHEFKKHPSISPIIKRNPPFFTSNHAPFLV